ncbi:hypothetical protein [Catellatospora sp. TT07R-123]|uniref:hypothetical protein n=1 Tax=Catellatospora sp. TT07R-123 TaxID=2733863 RepID=UPI001BB3D0D8|nr:hypothetical protein [Catellatospora sp. TT07R-123]
MTLQVRAKSTLVAGLAVAVYGLVEFLSGVTATFPMPVSLLLAMAVAVGYVLFVAAPGERQGFGLVRPLWRLPLPAKVVWVLFLLPTFALQLFAQRLAAGPLVIFPAVAVYFGVTFALMSWERLRGLGSAGERLSS